MRKPVVLISGANGEIGHGLIPRLLENGELGILAIDLKEIDPSVRDFCQASIVGDVLNQRLLKRLSSKIILHERKYIEEDLAIYSSIVLLNFFMKGN